MPRPPTAAFIIISTIFPPGPLFRKSPFDRNMPMSRETTVAVVDDSPVVRAFVSFLLIKNDLTVAFEAADGQECLEKINGAGKAPRVVILDIYMPVMNGFETASVIKTEWPDTKIIALSDKSDLSTVGQITSAGADYFISKKENITHLLMDTLSLILPESR